MRNIGGAIEHMLIWIVFDCSLATFITRKTLWVTMETVGDKMERLWKHRQREAR